MGSDLRNTAYCGLFCGDCIPSNEALFDAVDELGKRLAELPVTRYASLRAAKNPVFEDFPTFVGILDEMRKIKCEKPCREGGGHSECPVRACARSKRYLGCWECDLGGDCELLAPLKEFHGAVIEHNLQAIRRFGTEEWSEHRGNHYPWEK